MEDDAERVSVSHGTLNSMCAKFLLDHTIIYQLWGDPLFWESAPDWEADRMEAEEAIAHVDEEQSSLNLKHTDLYNAWVNEINRCRQHDQKKLNQIVRYIQRRRNYRNESIVMELPKTRQKVTLYDAACPTN